MSHQAGTLRSSSIATKLVRALFQLGCDGAFVEIRIIFPSGPVLQRFHQISHLNLQELERFDGGADVYYGVVPRLEPRGTADACGAAPAVWADFDNGAPSGLLLSPSIVVETSPGRYQALWLVREPCHDLDRVEVVNRSIASLFGADANCCDRARVLRLPGFHNMKYPDRPVALLRVCRLERRFPIDELEAVFGRGGPVPQKRGQTRFPKSQVPRWLGLVYEAIVEDLAIAGLAPQARSDGGVMANCPMHNDRNPSLSLHPTRGWKCFAGCGEGRLTGLASKIGVNARRVR